MSNVIDLTADDAPPAAPPVVHDLTLDSDSDAEQAPANAGEPPQLAPAAAADDEAPMAPEPPVDAPAAASDAQMAPAQPPVDAHAAPDETLDEPPAPPRRARAASDASDAGEPKRQRVDAPAPAPDESEASEASDESGSKRHDESDGEAAPPPPDRRRDRYGPGYVYDPYGPFGGGPDAAPAPVAAAAQPPAPDSDSDVEVAPAPAPAPAPDPDETQMEDDPELARAMEASRASVQEDAQRRRRSWSTDDRTPLSVAEYYSCFQAAQDNMVYSLAEIEDGSGVRAGNGAGSVKADGQGTAQYGRILTGATEDVANELGITDKDTALDIGSGVGNTSKQIASTRGCEARGLELLEGRAIVGTELSGAVDAEINERHALRRCGDCELRWGNMRDEQWWDFLTKAREGGHMKVFVNNFADVMSHRSTENGPTLDDRICAIFAALQPGARMLTLNRMLALGPSRDEANQVRERRGLARSDDASFFSYRTVTLEPKARPWAPDGEDVVSWSGLPIEAHVYERLGGQSLPGGAAAFLCSMKGCPGNALATAVLDDESHELVTECVICGEPRQRATRERRQVSQSSSRGSGESVKTR